MSACTNLINDQNKGSHIRASIYGDFKSSGSSYIIQGFQMEWAGAHNGDFQGNFNERVISRSVGRDKLTLE